MGFITDIYFTFLYQPLLNALIFLYDFLPGNDVGVAIIVLTLIIRFLLYPFSKKSIISQRALQKLQPKMDEIRKKYKDDKEAQSQELMKLYSEHKVNPLSSCFPLLVQLPIIYALYRVFQSGLTSESISQLYSFIPNPEVIDPYFFGVVDLSQTGNIFLALIAGGVQFVNSWMLMMKRDKKDKEKNAKEAKKKAESPEDKAQEMTQSLTKNMTYFFPLLTVWFGYVLPAGLPLYWIVTTLFAIAQQYFIERKDKNTEEVSSEVKTTS